MHLLLTAFLKRRNLTEVDNYLDSDIYLRNVLIISLQYLLDVDLEFFIGNISIKELKEIINILSSSLYYDNNYIILLK